MGREFEATVIVDVLSFSTSLDAALSAGAVVYPYPWRGDLGAARAFAGEVGGRLAVQRQDASGGPSLSPPTLLQLAAGDILVLPSPNGSTLTTKAASPLVFAACLRNYRAVAEAVKEQAPRVLVVPAGERWPDGSLRPALEDWLGAGAVISILQGEKSAEALAAERAFLDRHRDIGATLHDCVSGQELHDMGFKQDVDFAAQTDVSHIAPELVDGAYRVSSREVSSRLR